MLGELTTKLTSFMGAMALDRGQSKNGGKKVKTSMTKLPMPSVGTEQSGRKSICHNRTLGGTAADKLGIMSGGCRQLPNGGEAA